MTRKLITLVVVVIVAAAASVGGYVLLSGGLPEIEGPGGPSVTTLPPTDVGNSSVMMHGKINSRGGSGNNIRVWFTLWETDSNDSKQVFPPVKASPALDTFRWWIRDLKRGTEYSYDFHMSDFEGTAWEVSGGVVTFKTGGEPLDLEPRFRTGSFTSDVFEVSSDSWQLWWEMTSGRGDESHFSYEIYEEGGVTPIDSWEVDASRFPGSSIQGLSNTLAGPGRFFYKIDASPDFQWLVWIKEI
ncbi:MAG: hypothetical protein ACE5LS_03390 [Thermoplasmata archaeon]